MGPQNKWVIFGLVFEAQAKTRIRRCRILQSEAFRFHSVTKEKLCWHLVSLSVQKKVNQISPEKKWRKTSIENLKCLFSWGYFPATICQPQFEHNARQLLISVKCKGLWKNNKTASLGLYSIARLHQSNVDIFFASDAKSEDAKVSFSSPLKRKKNWSWYFQYNSWHILLTADNWHQQL